MNLAIKFGTDGWRGVIAEDFTFDNVRYCAQGVADYLKAAELAGRGLVIGYATRLSGQGIDLPLQGPYRRVGEPPAPGRSEEKRAGGGPRPRPRLFPADFPAGRP